MGRGRAPCCDKSKLRTGPWSPAEDLRLINFIQKHGHINWHALAKQAGLLRCGKSCRLRWTNYLRPDVKLGNFTPQELQTIIDLRNSIGNKWSKIASCLPGRTDNEIKNVWNTHLKKRVLTSTNNSADNNFHKTEAKEPNMDDSITASTHQNDNESSSNLSNSSPDNGPQDASDIDLDYWEVVNSLDPLQIDTTELRAPDFSITSGSLDHDAGQQEMQLGPEISPGLDCSPIWACSPHYLGI